MTNILIVDDDRLIREMLLSMMEVEEYEVTAASNGNEAIRRLRQCPADLVITDLAMPERDGFEIIREVRLHYPETRIIAISGNSSPSRTEGLSRAEALGADRTIAKPFSSVALLQMVRELLGGVDPAGSFNPEGAQDGQG
ncbi:response regulator [bacterium]|nr:response regulator [candidate division CSSED10-310 bacterium]